MGPWVVLVLLLLPTFAMAAVVQKVAGPDQSEVSHASSGGGAHIYLSGVDIGSAFAPPKVFIGINADAECKVQPFTSSRNRLHCIVSPENLPAPNPDYYPNGLDLNFGGGGHGRSGRTRDPLFVREPLRVLKEGRLAPCWHVGGLNHNCMIEFDVAATPRVYRMLTTLVESGGHVRVVGRGIDGGVTGDPKVMATLYRGHNMATGSCGQKDCQASNMGMETVGCITRLGGEEGDSVLGQKTAVATAYSSDNSFGCKLGALEPGLTAGFFNLSLYLNDAKHRGNAYLGFMSTGAIDLSTGSPFDAELLPRISEIVPSEGSLAGGTDLTIFGTGFGADTTALRILVGSASCAVTSVTKAAIQCRMEELSNGLDQPPVAIGSARSSPGERGVRWQLADGKIMLLPSFATDFGWVPGQLNSQGSVISPDWTGANAAGTTTFVDGWFEAPVDGDVTFMLRQDVVSKLYWSGSAAASRTTMLANVASVMQPPVLVERWNNVCAPAFPASPCRRDVWKDGLAPAHPNGPRILSSSHPNGLAPNTTSYAWTVRSNSNAQQARFTCPATCDSCTPAWCTFDYALRYTGQFQAPKTGTYNFKVRCGPHVRARFFINGVLLVECLQVTAPVGYQGENAECSDGACNDGAANSGTTSWADRFNADISLIGGQWYNFELQHQAAVALPAGPAHGRAGVQWRTPGDCVTHSGELHCEDVHLFANGWRDFSPTPRVWPSLESTSSAVSPRVTLVRGQRYWLGLECNHSATTVQLVPGSSDPRGVLTTEMRPCAVGARIHTTRLPVDSSIERRRLASRTRAKTVNPTSWPWPILRTSNDAQCNTILNHERCCASFDLWGDPCVPAIETFGYGRVCMNAQWVAEFEPTKQAACPPRRDPATKLARARAKLGHMVGCHTLTDRVACSSAVDGRTQATHLNQPCIAASTRFANGNVCETAWYVKNLDPTGAASLVEAVSPYMQVASGQELLHHEVQSITLTQANATKMEQTITFTFIECTGNYTDSNCIGTRGGFVHLALGDRLSLPIHIASPIDSYDFRPAAMQPLLGDTYSGVAIKSVDVQHTNVTWVLELTTSWASCTNQLNLPLLSTVREAKATANVTVTRTASCLSGGIDLAYGNGSTTAFLPWSANESTATAIIASLLPNSFSIDRTDNVDLVESSSSTLDWSSVRSDRVMVQRSGDGHTSALFTVTFLGVGTKEMLRVSSAGGLQKSTFSSLSPPTLALTSRDVSVAVTRLMPGGVDLTPLPGRYLSAAANSTVVSVRINPQTTAACSATNWEVQYMGCYTLRQLPTAASSHFWGTDRSTELVGAPLPTWERNNRGVSPQRCFLKCQSQHGSSAVAFGLHKPSIRNDMGRCRCYTSEPSNGTVAPHNCKDTCNDEGFLCGRSDDEITGNGVTGSGIRPASTSFPAPLCSNTCNWASDGDCDDGGPGSETSSCTLGDDCADCGPATDTLISVYRMPAPATSCSFTALSSRTATLIASSATALAANATLTLTGNGFGKTGATVTVCGGRTCAVASQTNTQITCRMPDCPVETTEKIFVHIAPYGYASNANSLSVKGVLSLAGVALRGGTTSGTPSGSAAGGVRLMLTGTGFSSDITKMQVDIMSSATVLAPCTVTYSTMGSIECLTSAAAAPLAAAGSTLDVRVSALGASNSVLSTSIKPQSYSLYSVANSVVIQSFPYSSGSTQGGLELCIVATNLNSYLGAPTSALNATQPAPTVLLGTARCVTTNASWTSTQLCCTTSAQPSDRKSVV